MRGPVTAGLGTLVRSASEAASRGAGADEIVALVEDMAARTRVLGALDTLRAPLDRFYGSLTDAQKAQFDRVGSRTSRRGG